MCWAVSRSSTGAPFLSLQLIRGFGGWVSATGEPICQPANAADDVFLDRVLRKPHPGSDFPLGQAPDPAQDEGLTRLPRHARDYLGQLTQVVMRDGVLFRSGGLVGQVQQPEIFDGQ